VRFERAKKILDIGTISVCRWSQLSSARTRSGNFGRSTGADFSAFSLKKIAFNSANAARNSAISAPSFLSAAWNSEAEVSIECRVASVSSGKMSPS
jgi:hypothetical protein